jgi:hypothetical protein
MMKRFSRQVQVVRLVPLNQTQGQQRSCWYLAFQQNQRIAEEQK